MGLCGPFIKGQRSKSAVQRYIVKIGLVIERQTPEYGGPSYFVRALYDQLATRKVDATVFALDRDACAQNCRNASLWHIGSMDAVHILGIWRPFNQLAQLRAHSCKRPVLLSTLGMLEPWALSHKALKKRMGMALYQRALLERADVLHAASIPEAENLRALGLKAPIAVIQHAVDVPRSERKLPCEASPPKSALFLSRLHPKKGLLSLVEAWARAAPQGWRVIVAGPDQDGHRREVERAVALRGVAHSFVFVGAVYGEARARLLRESDLLVLPSHSENFGFVVAEALACGRPVITTTATPWRDLQTTGSGYWVEPDVASLAEALSHATSRDAAELNEMGERGRALIMTKYSWPTVIAQHVATYRWLVGEEPKPSCVV